MTSKRGNRSGRDDAKTDQPLQAVLLADSFSSFFRPITLEKPKALLPLVNIPLLEYPIELLASSGVKEVIVFCVSHAEEIAKFLEHSRCSKIVKLRCLNSSSCLSAGDALRELDRMHVIRSDPFILISGDVVSNMNLEQAIKEHQERRKNDPSSIMTLIFKEAHPSHPTRRLIGDLVVGMDHRTQQVVLYDDNEEANSISLPTIFLQEHQEIQLSYDLLDCHIDICSPEVLVQFSDNFDYLDIRRDFIHNEVQSYEVGHKIFAKIITDEYAAPVHDPRSYDAVSRDIIRRWMYPMVPDNNILGSTTYSYQRGGIYKEDQVSLARSSVIGEHTVIGYASKVEENSHISCSVLGRNCCIGSNVTINGCYLWDNVTIEDGAVLNSSIFCNGVIVRKNATIERGCILSYDVIVGEGFTVKEFTRLTKSPPIDAIEDQFGDGMKNTEKDNIHFNNHDDTIIGNGGDGRIWIETDGDYNAAQIRKMCIGATECQEKQLKRWDEWDHTSDDEDAYTYEKETPHEHFIRVVRDMVQSGIRHGHSVDHVFLEIKSFKFAQNHTFSDCIHAILPAVIDSADELKSDGDSSMDILKEILPLFDLWGKPLSKWIMGEVEEIAVIQSLANHITQPSKKDILSPLFRYLLQRVYDLELASEETILSWAESVEGGVIKELVQTSPVQEFLQWLECEEEESSENE